MWVVVAKYSNIHVLRIQGERVYSYLLKYCTYIYCNTDTNGAEESVISEVEMHARVVLGVGKGVLFREVSSVQEFP